MYAEFAQVYDRLMAEVDYPAWAQHYRDLLSLHQVPDGALVTECACGTGSLTRHLARHYRMTGVDLSQGMLSIAADKLRSDGLQVPLVRQDMQRLRVHKPQQAVLATCDGVNYLTTPGALKRFFAAAHAALVPGGVLAFDVSTPYKLSVTLGQNTLSRLEGDVHYLWQNCFDEKADLLHMLLHLYAREPDGRYRLIREEQVQRAWRLTELTEALGEAGFTGIRAFGGTKRVAPADQDARWHLLAQRPNP